MNVDIKKQEILTALYQAEQEANILIERTHVFREELLKVKTIEELIVFVDTHDLEAGLKHIVLF